MKRQLHIEIEMNDEGLAGLDDWSGSWLEVSTEQVRNAISSALIGHDTELGLLTNPMYGAGFVAVTHDSGAVQ